MKKTVSAFLTLVLLGAAALCCLAVLLIYLRYFVRISLALTFIFLFMFTVSCVHCICCFFFHFPFCSSVSAPSSFIWPFGSYDFCFILYLYSVIHLFGLMVHLQAPFSLSLRFVSLNRPSPPQLPAILQLWCSKFETLWLLWNCSAMFLYWFTGYKELHENILFLSFNGFHFVCTCVFSLLFSLTHSGSRDSRRRIPLWYSLWVFHLA